MSVSYNIRGRDDGTVESFQKIGKAIDGTAKSAKEAARETAKLDAAAQKIKESINPQEKLNRLYKELGQHVKAGRLSMDEATAQGVKYRQQLTQTAHEGEKAFGPSSAASWPRSWRWTNGPPSASPARRAQKCPCAAPSPPIPTAKMYCRRRATSPASTTWPRPTSCAK
jgi:hypothetical protein